MPFEKVNSVELSRMALGPLIKLWIADIREDMPWDNLIRAANKVKARAKIQRNTHLDQRCPKRKHTLKMSLNTQDNQAEKPKTTTPQARAHSPPADQSEASGWTRREKKQMCQGRRGHREASPATSQEDAFKPNASKTDAFKANVTQAGDAQKEVLKKKRRNSPIRRDISEVKCYNCNKKGYYTKYCTKLKD